MAVHQNLKPFDDVSTRRKRGTLHVHTYSTSCEFESDSNKIIFSPTLIWFAYLSLS